MLLAAEWAFVARELTSAGKTGVLFVDNAHEHVHELNDLVDTLVSEDLKGLFVVGASSRNHWHPRVKTPNVFKIGKEFHLSRLDTEEIETLLNLVEKNDEILRLVENTFAGFSRLEKRRRLVERADAITLYRRMISRFDRSENFVTSTLELRLFQVDQFKIGYYEE